MIRIAKRVSRALGHRVDLFAGEHAIASALARVGRGPESMRRPDPEVSLTHSERATIAAVARGLEGVGIDHEGAREVSPAMARWYLDRATLAWVERMDDRTRGLHLLRLWTVKEALFKACPGNARLALSDLVLASPAAWTGAACVVGGSRWRLRYSTLPYAGGFLSVAICGRALAHR